MYTALRLREIDTTWNAAVVAAVLEPALVATRVYMHAMRAIPGSRRTLLCVLGRRLASDACVASDWSDAYIVPRRDACACTARTRAGKQCARTVASFTTRFCAQHHTALVVRFHGASGTAAKKLRLKEKSAP